jgi:hypothetical protein
MKTFQVIYMISALTLSGIIVGVSCLQFFDVRISLNGPFEEPIDEDAKDISDDFADDKENTTHEYISSYNLGIAIHSDGYLISHANHVKEIATPPPKYS